MIESNRIKKLRHWVINTIPKFPNDKATRQLLEAKSLSGLFIDYVNWASRLVAARPRKVAVESTATSDPRWEIHQNDIQFFLNKVANGDDLSPHLSLGAFKEGFTPASSQKALNVERWADKDFVLITMGFHHFHIGTKIEEAGHVSRTNEVLFAKVARDTFEVLAIFDHSVFERSDSVNATMTSERKRLWDIFDNKSRQGIPSGSVYVPSMIMTSGHSYYHIGLAQNYARIVHDIDPKLDDRQYIRKIYGDASLPIPERPKLRWAFDCLDFGLFDDKGKFFFIILYGPT
ncbi:MAG: hypothetical protein A2X82_05225 [Geobacteraceae bacterium GWC2_55_20]|nr:MAG: hypothetical protein A2X82_05225 [Geobacteraceae bacterium GWC2_55_20]OGU25457.1 MAG: hypothetical protein A2X85_11770 [Geobacteraceae bacterium GWF2_54_21]HCE68984.1 hypothetical protein [Geobacter sp.]